MVLSIYKWHISLVANYCKGIFFSAYQGSIASFGMIASPTPEPFRALLNSDPSQKLPHRSNAHGIIPCKRPTVIRNNLCTLKDCTTTRLAMFDYDATVCHATCTCFANRSHGIIDRSQRSGYTDSMQ